LLLLLYTFNKLSLWIRYLFYRCVGSELKIKKFGFLIKSFWEKRERYKFKYNRFAKMIYFIYTFSLVLFLDRRPCEFY
jgi:hypothetical protein